MARDYYAEMLSDAVLIMQAFKDGNSNTINNSDMACRIDGYLTLIAPNFPYLQFTSLADVDSAGWKFHFSVAAADTKKAWNLLVDLLVRDGDQHLAKVALPFIWDELSDPTSGQAGKFITLYENGRYTPERYMRIISAVEELYRANHIARGIETTTDRAVPNSVYASYKRERDEDGIIRSKDKDIMHLPVEKRYNPYGKKDPYADFAL